MKATSIIWRRTFPDSEPGTDGVAIFEGRVIGRVRLLANAPRDPKPWLWSVTDPTLASNSHKLGRSRGLADSPNVPLAPQALRNPMILIEAHSFVRRLLKSALDNASRSGWTRAGPHSRRGSGDAASR